MSSITYYAYQGKVIARSYERTHGVYAFERGTRFEDRNLSAYRFYATASRRCEGEKELRDAVTALRREYENRALGTKVEEETIACG